jgi:hypothetical protein
MSAFSIRKYKTEDYLPCRALWRELTEWHRHIYDAPQIGRDARAYGCHQLTMAQ